MDDNRVIDLRDLLAAPLVATINADFEASQRFVEFITAYGFESMQSDDSMPDSTQTESGRKPLKLRMVTFWYPHPNPQTQQIEYVRVQVPALSLIPLPMLQVADAEFDFNIRIHTETEPTSRPESRPNALRQGFKSAEVAQKNEQGTPPYQGFKARLSPTMGQKGDEIVPTMDANMKVRIKMRQADMPAGIANLMTLFADGTTVEKRSNDTTGLDELEAAADSEPAVSSPTLDSQPVTPPSPNPVPGETGDSSSESTAGEASNRS